MTLYIILGIATGIIVILLGVVLVVVFRRRDSGVTSSPDRSKKGYVKGNVKGDTVETFQKIQPDREKK